MICLKALFVVGFILFNICLAKPVENNKNIEEMLRSLIKVSRAKRSPQNDDDLNYPDYPGYDDDDGSDLERCGGGRGRGYYTRTSSTSTGSTTTTTTTRSPTTTTTTTTTTTRAPFPTLIPIDIRAREGDYQDFEVGQNSQPEIDQGQTIVFQ